MNIERTSYALIYATSLPMYSGEPVFHRLGRLTTLSWVLFRMQIVPFYLCVCNYIICFSFYSPHTFSNRYFCFTCGYFFRSTCPINMARGRAYTLKGAYSAW